MYNCLYRDIYSTDIHKYAALYRRVAFQRGWQLPLSLPRDLSYESINPSPCEKVGAPERSRTPNPQIRSLVLYPIELRALAETRSVF
jgi:hypothetical protein